MPARIRAAARVAFGSDFVTSRGTITIALGGAAAGAVPEPATWAMMILGTGAIGCSLRAAKRRSHARFDAKIERITAGAIA